MTFGEMLLEMAEGRHVGSSRRPVGAVAVAGLALALTGVARSRLRPGRAQPSGGGRVLYPTRTYGFSTRP